MNVGVARWYEGLINVMLPEEQYECTCEYARPQEAEPRLCDWCGYRLPRRVKGVIPDVCDVCAYNLNSKQHRLNCRS